MILIFVSSELVASESTSGFFVCLPLVGRENFESMLWTAQDIEAGEGARDAHLKYRRR